MMEESDPVQEFLCTKPRGNGDGRRGRPRLRWFYKLEDLLNI
jgi:hypothetical protein